MSDDFDKHEWQKQQAMRDAAWEKQREKNEKAKARAARNAQRKLERLSRTLKDKGELTEWEEEFSDSVSERLEKFGSAFADPEKGRASDALSFAQKKVVSSLKKKAKSDNKRDKASSNFKNKSGFKSKGGFKNKKKFTPRVRHIEDDFAEGEIIPQKNRPEPFIPEYEPTKPKRPFLRIVKNEDE